MITRTSDNMYMKAGCVLLALLVATGAMADIQAVIVKTSGQRVAGAVRWKGSARVYVVKTRSGTFEIPLRDVSSVRAPKPRTLDGAIRKIKSGAAAGAIPALKKIAADYEMIEWDVVATRYLAEAYLKNNMYAEATRVAEKILDSSGTQRASSELMEVYCQALMKDKKYGKLKMMLTKMIETGSRSAAAVAQVKRGDIDRQNGNVQDALINGYLRTIVLYRDIKSVQPEALYKAMGAFKEMGHHSRAQKMRKKLLAEYPQSTYSAKAKAES